MPPRSEKPTVTTEQYAGNWVIVNQTPILAEFLSVEDMFFSPLSGNAVYPFSSLIREATRFMRYEDAELFLQQVNMLYPLESYQRIPDVLQRFISFMSPPFHQIEIKAGNSVLSRFVGFEDWPGSDGTTPQLPVFGMFDKACTFADAASSQACCLALRNLLERNGGTDVIVNGGLTLLSAKEKGVVVTSDNSTKFMYRWNDLVAAGARLECVTQLFLYEQYDIVQTTGQEEVVQPDFSKRHRVISVKVSDD